MIKNKFILQLLSVVFAPVITAIIFSIIGIAISLAFGINYYEAMQSVVSILLYIACTVILGFYLPVMIDEIESDNIKRKIPRCQK